MSVAIANQLFLAYLGRPADAQWRASTANLLNGNAPSVALQGAFYNAALADGAFSTTDSNSTLVDKIFRQTFGFGASSFEQTEWGKLITNGTISTATAAWTIFSSYANATNVPAAYQSNNQAKLIAINAYTDQLILPANSASNLALSQGGGAAALARSFTEGVKDTATAAVAVTNIASTVASLATAQTGSIFTLTTGADNIVGTGLNDLINGVVGGGAASTLTAADVINGGAGTDTISVAVLGAGSLVGSALVSNVEIVNARGTVGGGAMTLDGTGQASLQTIGLTGDFGAGSSLAATSFAAPVTLNLTGATLTGAVGIAGTGATTVTINSTSAANSMGGFTAANATTLNIAAATNFTATGVNMLTGGTAGVVNVSGTAASVALGLLGTTVGTVTASGLTAGGITATLGSATQVVTGGAGQDIISTGGVVLTTGSVNAGAGTTDRLVVTNTADLTAVTGAKYTNFEQLQVSNGVTANASFLSGITDIRIDDGGAATAVTNLTSAQAGKIAIINANAAGAITIGLADSTGTADAVVATVTNTNAAGAAQPMNLTGMSLVGVETLSLTTTGTVAATSGLLTLDTSAAVSLQNISYTTLGAANVTISAGHTGLSLVVNGTASTGIQTINGSGYNAGGAANTLTINTGSGADVITGSTTKINNISSGSGNDQITGGTLNDIINAGDGDDFITGAGGADAMTSGAGNDTFRFVATGDTQSAALVAQTDYAVLDRITDFNGNGVAVGDGISLGLNFSAGVVYTPATIGLVTSLTINTVINTFAELFTALGNQTVSTAVIAQIFDVTLTGGNLTGRLMVVNDNVAAIDAADAFVNITGITGALNQQDFVFA